MKTASQKHNAKKKRLKNKADKLLREYIKTKYPRCKLCGNPTSAGHHIIPKSRSNAVRYYLPNIIPLCQGCHGLWHNTQDPRLFERMKKLMGGEKWWKDLLIKSKKKSKRNMKVYEDAIQQFHQV